MTNIAGLDGAVSSTPLNQSGDRGAIPASKLHFRRDRIDDAERLVRLHHYSHRWPNSIVVVGTFHEDGGLFGDAGRCIAACCFGIPPTRWSEEVLELQRLVCVPDAKTELSQLIGLTCRAVRRGGRYDLLVSFADKGAGHEGYVYRASCWNYDGCREPRVDGCIVGGEFIPGRSCNSAWGTRSPSRLRAMGKEVEAHYDAGKHLYWRALSMVGETKALRLGLRRARWIGQRIDIVEKLK